MRVTHQFINVSLVAVLAATYAPMLVVSARKTLAARTLQNRPAPTQHVSRQGRSTPFAGGDAKKVSTSTGQIGTVR